MKFIVLLCITVPLALTLRVSPLDNHVVVTGRYVQDGNCVSYDWSGVSFAFNFHGSDCSVNIYESTENRYYVEVDGIALPPLVTNKNTSGTYQIAKGLFKSGHSVYIYKMTEALFGQAMMCGFDIDGTLLAPHVQSRRTIEIIGDSLTCGYGNEGPDRNCPFSAASENNYLAYGSLVARMVGARLYTAAWSGMGMVRNYGDPNRVSPEPFPTKYVLSMGTNNSIKWDFHVIPDLVIINLGANDYSTQPTPTYDQFALGYHKFLALVRSKYPSTTKYICTAGHDDYAVHVNKIVQEEVASGHKDISFTSVSMDDLDNDHDLGCSWHPNVRGQAKMAQKLIDQVRNVMLW